MSDNTLNIEYLAHLISVTADNTQTLYNERFNTRRKVRNIAISELMYFIDMELDYNGYSGFYATNKQVMAWDKQHGQGLEKVLDIVTDDIIREREERGARMKRLTDYFNNVFCVMDDSDNARVEIDGVLYDFETTLSADIPDDICNRVLVNGEYYYFSVDCLPIKF